MTDVIAIVQMIKKGIEKGVPDNLILKAILDYCGDVISEYDKRVEQLCEEQK